MSKLLLLTPLHYVKKGIALYQVVKRECRIQTPFRGFEVEDTFYSLDKNGILTLKIGYAWDGPTCAANTDDFILGSGGHDPLCEMIDNGQLPPEMQCLADELMSELNELEQVWSDGEREVILKMHPFRRAYVYIMVRLFQYRKRKDNSPTTIYTIRTNSAVQEQQK